MRDKDEATRTWIHPSEFIRHTYSRPRQWPLPPPENSGPGRPACQKESSGVAPVTPLDWAQAVARMTTRGSHMTNQVVCHERPCWGPYSGRH